MVSDIRAALLQTSEVLSSVHLKGQMSNQKTFGFKTQLGIGARGEARFATWYAPSNVTQTNGRRGDFASNAGLIIEVKSDSYTTARTMNFFMERYGNVEKLKPGGPYQSVEHGCTYFVYSFADGHTYWFELETLLPWLEANIETYKARFIQNRGYSGMGYLVPRADLLHLCVKIDVIAA